MTIDLTAVLQSLEAEHRQTTERLARLTKAIAALHNGDGQQPKRKQTRRAKTHLTPEQWADAEQQVRVGVRRSFVARTFGISPSAITAHMKRTQAA